MKLTHDSGLGPSNNESIFLLHGLAAPRLVMSRLTTYLNHRGYLARNWGYASLRSSIQLHATALRRDLIELDRDPRVESIHLVTHSMGSIIARCALLDGTPDKLSRIVMLGPPNHGSHVARALSRPLGWFCPPLRELSDVSDSFVNRLNEPTGLEIGVIAAAEDLVVPRDSTHLQCQREHIVLPGHHGVLPWRRDTAECVHRFLETGTFTTSPANVS
ncbi:MAG: hypothetical protein P8N76_23760 [Pirellulaceae bacterium]|nr:hypothetical protein [Pirellulaceae bacterium]